MLQAWAQKRSLSVFYQHKQGEKLSRSRPPLSSSLSHFFRNLSKHVLSIIHSLMLMDGGSWMATLNIMIGIGQKTCTNFFFFSPCPVGPGPWAKTHLPYTQSFGQLGVSTEASQARGRVYHPLRWKQLSLSFLPKNMANMALAKKIASPQNGRCALFWVVMFFSFWQI